MITYKRKRPARKPGVFNEAMLPLGGKVLLQRLFDSVLGVIPHELLLDLPILENE